MIGRSIIAIAVSVPLLGALAGVTAAETLFPPTLEAPEAQGATQSAADILDSELAPAFITITVRTSPLAHSISYLDEGLGFTVPVYFAPENSGISDDAHLALAALADEAAAASSVAITVSAAGYNKDGSASLQDARAVSAFDTLSALGVPVRVMALELGQEDTAEFVASSI